jgi:hypothetical protein
MGTANKAMKTSRRACMGKVREELAAGGTVYRRMADVMLDRVVRSIRVEHG